MLTDFNVRLRSLNEISIGNSFGCISASSCAPESSSFILMVSPFIPSVML